ncbi:HD domain-containing protein [Guptibacillus algicola]|uniref:HD domain-containing protein n=1 Tax=Guptibacillus algicola TaxID=225844 RepID=UPI001CD7199D|nr:HD domain-containing protein [Alkalihalobacillus algicola]MCA0987723.1 HD domain-containing protein [Alkalihalobacillus algicola]
MENVIQELRRYVEQKLENEGSGHDWSHIDRVTRLAIIIAEAEQANLFVCEAAALVHDLVDDKLTCPEEGFKEVEKLLRHVEENDRNHIIEIISTISFKGGKMPPVRSLEAKVVQDADRLDAIGAIGIARTFVYAGSKGDMMYDPSLTPREEMSASSYREGRSTAINHFYEKLLKLKDLMNTEKGKELAEERHACMESFLEQFHYEWEGKKKV